MTKLTPQSSYIDPDLLPGLSALADMMGDGPGLIADLAGTRAASAARDAQLTAGLNVPETIAQEVLKAPSSEGHDIDLRVMRPSRASGETGGKLPLFFWVHGGGYVMGTAQQGDMFTLNAAQGLGCFAASVEYRLSPETAYPGPLEDCYEGLKYLLDNAAALNIDTDKVVIGGVSAGGGLAAGLALLVRDRGLCEPLGQVLIYPMIDDTNVAPPSDSAPDTLVWSRSFNAFGWQSYLGDLYGQADVPIYAAPARAKDLSGLPPTYMPVGDLDLFLDENIRYARKLTQAGVPLHFHIVPGAFHGFNGFVAGAPVSQAINAETFGFVGKLLAEAA